MDSVVDSIQYANGSDDPAGGDRVIALTAIQDNGGTTNGGRDTTSLDIESTVHVVPVNDAPTLSATGTTVTAIEQGAAVVLFSNAAVSTIESGQTVTGLQIQVSNAGDTLSESLTIDGSQVGLRAGNSVTTADHGMTAAVTYSSGIATVTLSSPSGVSATAIQDIVDGMTYSDATPTSTGLDRTVTLHAITDNGGAANDGIDTTSLSIATTVHIALVNDAPTLLAIPADPTFTEGQDPGGPIFAGALADAVESNQLLPRLTLTVSNVTDGPAESLGIDGSTLALTDGNSLVTAGHGAMAAVSLDGTTATVTLSDVTGLSASAMSSLIAGLTYSNSSDNPSAAGRTVTLTSLQDNGGTANGGHDAGSFDIASTVQVVPVDDPAVAHNDVFTTDEASAIGHGSSVFADNGSGIDSDVDGPALQVAAVNGDAAAVGEEITLASGAHLTLNADGTFAYDPDHAFDYLAAPGSGASDTAATDSFTYTLANGGTAIATVAISGIDGNDLVQGTAGADLLSAGAGDDVIMAGGGNDTINGGRGTDTAVYSGAHGDYTVTFDAGSQSFTVADNRAGSPDGTDTLTHVETFRFSDGQFDYDPAGHLVSQTIANGDGSTATTLFDAEGQSPWAAQVIATDAAGSIASQTIDLDNGGKWVNTYDTTNASAELWDSQQFDVNGQLIERTVTQDDGTHTLTINDVADSYAWSTATISFDAKWNMTAFSGVNDDGTATETMAAIGPALDTMLWFATPYDANQGMATGIALTGGANIDVLYGHAGDDVLSGGGGDDVIAGGRGNDTLSGGLGDDHFAFTDGDGNDTVTDFSSGDVIALHAYDISDFAALLLHMEQSGGDTVITFDPENSITLHGVMPSQLHAEDFLFV
jgi:Ca2+-binding RTX toxin-like protein